MILTFFHGLRESCFFSLANEILMFEMSFDNSLMVCLKYHSNYQVFDSVWFICVKVATLDGQSGVFGLVLCGVINTTQRVHHGRSTSEIECIVCSCPLLGRGGSSGAKFRISLGLPVGAVINCADNTGTSRLTHCILMALIRFCRDDMNMENAYADVTFPAHIRGEVCY